MITRGSKELENVSPEIIVWAAQEIRKGGVGTTVEAGLSGEWCRSMTATITAYQRMMFE
jgi:hypothetical protein